MPGIEVGSPKKPMPRGKPEDMQTWERLCGGEGVESACIRHEPGFVRGMYEGLKDNLLSRSV